MTLSSHPLIAVDFNDHEHNLEWRGHSQGDAAERMLRHHANFKAVLNGKQGGKNNAYRKLVRTQHGVEADETALGQALLEAQSTQSLEAGQLILSALQKKGLRLEIIEKEDGTEKIVVRPKGVITPEESAEIDENQASIVVLLRKQEQEEAAAGELSSATEPKESQRDIIRRMLPDLPDSFIRYDLEQLLRRSKYQELADKSSKLDNLLAWCATQGLITRTGKGHYRRLITVDTIASEPAPIEFPEDPQQLPLAAQETQLGSSSVTEVEKVFGAVAPEWVREVQAAREPSTSGNGSTPIEQNPETSPRPEPAPSSLTQALIDLTSQLATVPIEESKLEAIERGAKELYESFERFMDPIDALIKQLRANIRTRDRLRTQLAARSEI